MQLKTGKALLLILDGYGQRDEADGNAVVMARTPYLHAILGRRPPATLSASGLDVGLPAGLMGNSEVGHLNLGAGRVVYQEITRIDREIAQGTFFRNPALIASVGHARRNGSAWHLMGLVSDGGVHSSLEHLFALLELGRRAGVGRVYVHAFLDGRDTPPHSGAGYLRRVQEKMAELGVGQIASVCGRYWAMDRDKRWPRTQRAYQMLTEGKGLAFADPVAAAEDSYRRGVTDEFVEPSVIIWDGAPVGLVRDGDAVVFFNFRADRARQLTLALADPKFEGFPRRAPDIHYTTMTRYHADYPYPAAFAPQVLTNLMGEVVAAAGLRQFRIAETEKYAHVTYFFNGGRETQFPGEQRVLVPSPQVATYDLKPEMSAAEVARRALAALDEDYAFVLVNFANPDMVGHTGVWSAAVTALEALDPLVKALTDKALSKGYGVMVTADHGNCEQMKDEDGEPHTAHTTNRVPLAVLLPDGTKPVLRQGGILADVAPTLLQFIGIPKPPEMEGRSLVI